jgi:hypothetical protein
MDVKNCPLECPARILYPTGIVNGLVQYSGMCIAARMIEIGVTPEGVRDFVNKFPHPDCLNDAAISKYINPKTE